MLLKGLLLSFSDPLLGLLPTIVPFQYNPTEVTRVFQVAASAASEGGQMNAPKPAGESYSLKLELDATDGLEKGAPVTSLLGIGPRLAAIEMLVQPVGSSLLGDLAGALLGGSSGATIPAGKLPLVFFAWGPARITPVVLSSLTIRETAFDELLNPVHATADLGLTVLRNADLDAGDTLAKAAADYYQGAREVKAIASLVQILELGG